MNPAEPGGVWRVMSPTSYQAAPPRESMIANAGAGSNDSVPTRIEGKGVRDYVTRSCKRYFQMVNIGR